MAIQKAKPTYSYEQYLTMIEQCNSLEELRLVREQFEGEQNLFKDMFEVIDIKSSMTFKLVSLNLQRADEL